MKDFKFNIYDRVYIDSPWELKEIYTITNRARRAGIGLLTDAELKRLREDEKDHVVNVYKLHTSSNSTNEYIEMDEDVLNIWAGWCRTVGGK